MSIPHTGHLVAEIDGQRCTFDGDLWKGPTPELEAQLNDATAHAPKHHVAISERANYVFYILGLTDQARILESRADAWPTELPPGAID
ncbi:MAG: hypothetical protein QOF48_1914 [Verrucomicrobiota bacterium]